MRTIPHPSGSCTASLSPRLLPIVLLVAALAGFPGLASAQQGRGSPASGFVYYGDATQGQPWSTKYFDNLSRSDSPPFRGTSFADLAFQVGDTLRARNAVNVRARPWLTQPEEPAVVGRLRAGDRIVIRDIHWVGLGPGLQRSAFWIEYERV